MRKKNLRFLTPTSILPGVTARIDGDGRLIFSRAAAEKMDIGEDDAIVFAVDRDIPDSLNLYLIVGEFKRWTDAFQIEQFSDEMGDYFYVDAQPVFDELGFRYNRFLISFEIEEVKVDGKKMYHLAGDSTPL